LIFYLIKGLEAMMVGGQRVFAPLKRIQAARVAPTALALLVFSIYSWVDLGFIIDVAADRKLEGLRIGPNFHMLATNDNAAKMLMMSAYVRDHAGPEAVVFSRKPRLTSLASGRPAVGGPFSSDPDEFIANLERRKISYVLLDDFHDSAQKYFVPAINAHPRRFEIVFRVPDSKCAVLKFE